jgi:hypothetical protein
MTEQQEGIAEQRDEISAHVAKFKATQEKFEREREAYFVTTLENARHPRERRSVDLRGFLGVLAPSSVPSST